MPDRCKIGPVLWGLTCSAALVSCGGGEGDGGVSDPESAASPSVVLYPTRLEFGETFPGEASGLSTFLVNTGGGRLDIREIVITRGLAGELRDARFRVGPVEPSILPGEAVSVPVTFVSSAGEASALARLRVFFRQPTAPVPELLLTAAVLEPPSRSGVLLPDARLASADPWTLVTPQGRDIRRIFRLEIPPSAPTSERGNVLVSMTGDWPEGSSVEPTVRAVTLGRRDQLGFRIATRTPLSEEDPTLRGTVRLRTGEGERELGTLVLDSLFSGPTDTVVSCDPDTSRGFTEVFRAERPVPNPHPPEGAGPLQSPFGSFRAVVETARARLCASTTEVTFRVIVELASDFDGRNDAAAAFLLRSGLCGRHRITLESRTNGFEGELRRGARDETDCASTEGPQSSKARAQMRGVHLGQVMTVTETGMPEECPRFDDAGTTRLSMRQERDGSDEERVSVELHWRLLTMDADCGAGSISLEASEPVFLRGEMVFDPVSGGWSRTTGDADGDGRSNYMEVLAGSGGQAGG